MYTSNNPFGYNALTLHGCLPTSTCVAYRDMKLLFNYLFPCGIIKTLTPELNPSAKRCLTRLFTGDFAS
jgi:hypothetical protein